ncbi:MAG: PHP domain-containing protein, partial [Acidobacteriota bacterium]
ASADELDIIAIADHDSIGGICEASKEAQARGLTLIPAIEFSCTLKEKDVHIIGYLTDCHNHALLKWVSNFQQARRQRLKEMVAILQSLGIGIDLQEIEGDRKAESMGRPHVAQAVVRKGYVNTTDEAYVKYLRKGAPAFVPKKSVLPWEVIDLVNTCGGISVWTHPERENLSSHIELLCSHGLHGVEAFNPKLRLVDTELLLQATRKHHLLVTGGSDWHGLETDKPLGNFSIDSEKIKPFFDLYQRLKEEHSSPEPR